MANIVAINANGELLVEDGVAYATVAGGATSFIPAHFAWYTGVAHTRALNLMVSNGVDPIIALGVIAIRRAVGYAAANHAADLHGDMIQAGGLALNQAEVITDVGINALTDYRKMDYAEVNAVGIAAAPPVAPAAIPVAFDCDRLSARHRILLARGDVLDFTRAAARMAYSIIGTNGIGLITSAHHLRGSAASLATNIMKLYAIDVAAKDLGLDMKEVTMAFFHHALHPIPYQSVAQWVQAIPASAAAKVAAPVSKRIPAYPGGTAFVKNALTIRRVVQAAELMSPLFGHLGGIAGPADIRLVALSAAIIATPLDYSAVFRPAAAAALQPEVDAVKIYVAVLAGIYDAWLDHSTASRTVGPTAGLGMQKFVQENIVPYANAKGMAAASYTAAIPVNAAGMPAAFQALGL